MTRSQTPTLLLGITFGTVLTLLLINSWSAGRPSSSSLPATPHDVLRVSPVPTNPASLNISQLLAAIERQPLQMLEEFLEANPRVAMDDPRLVGLIRQLLVAPSRNMDKQSFMLRSTPQADAVMDLLNNQEGGFFVEAGAQDGERASNTLWLERKLGWTGLLVELDPFFFWQLLGKNRKCYAAHACLSGDTRPVMRYFQEDPGGLGKLTDSSSGRKVTCLPLYSLLLAINRTRIDYLSLDVEGFELPVLRTIPFDKLDIRVLSVEYAHGGPRGLRDYTEFMTSKGYDVHKHIIFSKAEISLVVQDLIFIKRDSL